MKVIQVGHYKHVNDVSIWKWRNSYKGNDLREEADIDSIKQNKGGSRGGCKSLDFLVRTDKVGNLKLAIKLNPQLKLLI